MQFLRKFSHTIMLILFSLSITGCTGQIGSQKALMDDWTQTNAAIYNAGWEAYKSGDYATALKKWTPLAEKGFARAQMNLGVLYASGLGVPKDDVEALRWSLKAAQQGYPVAQNTVGVVYLQGQGVTQDYAAALKWFKLAAEQKNADAQNNLGIMYDNGFSVNQDFTRAFMWLDIAASQGQLNAVANRSKVENKMTPANISKAQELVRECVTKNYKGC